MLSKLSPMLLISTSVGGGLLIANYGFRDFRLVSTTNVGDADWLRERNPNAFQISQESKSLGYAWKNATEGDVFKDETYYAFQDWSWLNGVEINKRGGQTFQGGEKLKNYIDGIGFQVTKINGGTDQWKGTEWERNRDFKLRRVLMSNYEGYRFGGGYKLFNKTSCLLKTSQEKATSGPKIYLMIGWASGGTKRDDGVRPENFQISNGYKDFCSWYWQGNYSGKKGQKTDSINITLNLKDGKTITGKEFPVIAHSKSFQPIYFINSQKQIIHPIILGVAIKGQIRNATGEQAGKRLTKDEAIEAIRKKINNKIVGMYDKVNKTNLIGLQFKEDSSNGNKFVGGEVTEQNDWGVQATFKYQYN